jgi:anti-sigma B factor antagonist
VTNTSPSEIPFNCEVEEWVEEGVKVKRVRCHGWIITQTAGEVRDIVKPLISQGGSILIDLGDVKFLDSLGLGTLVGLKASAIKEECCTLKLENVPPRIREILRLTNLTNLFFS